MERPGHAVLPLEVLTADDPAWVDTRTAQGEQRLRPIEQLASENSRRIAVDVLACAFDPMGPRVLDVEAQPPRIDRIAKESVDPPIPPASSGPRREAPLVEPCRNGFDPHGARLLVAVQEQPEDGLPREAAPLHGLLATGKPGAAESLRRRKLVEEAFGWGKTKGRYVGSGPSATPSRSRWRPTI